MLTVIHTTEVTIDYDATMQLFLSQKEEIEFSPERMVSMLNGWARIGRVKPTSWQRREAQIAITQGRCILTEAALASLVHLYQKTQKWHDQYPYAGQALQTLLPAAWLS